jgi:hypothetical protein
MDRKGLGRRVPRRLAVTMRGRLWWAVVAAFLVLLVAFGPELLRLGMLLAIPWNCDEGMASDWRAVNARGDIVAAYAKACTGVGTVVDYSVVLQPRGADKVTTLVEHSELYYGYPKFRWIDDDALSIDLGNVRAVWGRSIESAPSASPIPIPRSNKARTAP